MKTVTVIALALLYFNSAAQSFKQLRYDEDYSYLANDTTSTWYKATKFKPLSRDKKTYLSFGGDIRYQYQWFKNENWGESPEDKNGFVLTRYLAHADLHIGSRFRTFVQLQSSFANGMADSPSPVDENQLDLHQAFADVALSQSLTLRAGRQELLYGSQRLVAVREGPNNRQSFDAARVLYARKGFKADAFFSYYVRSKPTIFDDEINHATKFWGVYLAKKHVDLYYFGLRKRTAGFDDGTGTELRHSIGSRIWNSGKHLRYDIEGLYQFGRFAGKEIDAWTFSINTGYKFSRLALGVKTELISGDRRYDDNHLQTFNPLFPRGGYFGLVSLIGPANLCDIHPSASLELSRKLTLNTDCDIFWRYSNKDGIYGPNVALIYSGKNSDKSAIGRQYSTDLEYVPNAFLYFRAEFTWFKAGSYLKEVGPGKDILFTACTVQFKF